MRWLSARSANSRSASVQRGNSSRQQIIADRIIDEEERADLLWLSHEFSTEDGYYDDVTSEMQRLQGILLAVLSDGRITPNELNALLNWVDKRAFLRRCWPYDELEASSTRDARWPVRCSEHEALVQFFEESVRSMSEKAIGVLDEMSRLVAVCATNPELRLTTNGSVSLANQDVEMQLHASVITQLAVVSYQLAQRHRLSCSRRRW